jgi:hypothetical protein
MVHLSNRSNVNLGNGAIANWYIVVLLLLTVDRLRRSAFRVLRSFYWIPCS